MAFFSFIIYLSKLRGNREECGVAFFNLFSNQVEGEEGGMKVEGVSRGKRRKALGLKGMARLDC